MQEFLQLVLRFWNHITLQTEVPSTVSIIIGAVVAITFIAIPQLWKIFSHVITIVHETGHALFGLLTFRRVRSIRLHSDTSGVTETAGWSPGLIAALAGYPFPTFLAVIFALMLNEGYPFLAPGIIAIICMLIFLKIGNVFGGLITIATGFISIGIIFLAPPMFNFAVTAFLMVFFALGAVKDVLVLFAAKDGGGIHYPLSVHLPKRPKILMPKKATREQKKQVRRRRKIQKQQIDLQVKNNRKQLIEIRKQQIKAIAQQRKNGELGPANDAEILQEMTFIFPAVLFKVIFMMVALTGLLMSLFILIGLAH